MYQKGVEKKLNYSNRRRNSVLIQRATPENMIHTQ